MKKIIAMWIIASLIILCMCGCKTKARETTTTSEVYATSFEATEVSESVTEEVIDVLENIFLEGDVVLNSLRFKYALDRVQL